MSKAKKTDAVSERELEETNGEPIPDREVMSAITPPGLTEPEEITSDPIDYGHDPLPKQ